MKESEARTKWCPMARMALVQGMAANRTGQMSQGGTGYANIYDETRCIGSDCMLWQPLVGSDDEARGRCSLGNPL